MTDDYASTTATNGALTIGAPAIAGYLDYNDADWFKVTLLPQTTYLFTYAADFLLPNSLSLLLRDASGSVVTPEAPSFRSPSVLQFFSAAGGDYYLDAHGPVNVPMGAYTVSAAIQQPDALPANITTPGSLVFGVSKSGVFEVAGDQDWYKFRAEVGQHYGFTSAAATDALVAPARIRVYDASGIVVDTGTYPFEPLATGDYFLGVESNLAGAYTLIPTMVQDDYSGNRTTTGVLLPGVELGAALEYNADRDSFKVTMQAGTTYIVEIVAASATVDRLFTTLTDSQGSYFRVEPERLSDTTYGLTFKPAVAGDYYVTVFSAAVFPESTRTAYTIKAAGARDDHGDDILAASPLTVGQTLPGKFQSAKDVDVAALLLEAGITYAFDVRPPSADPSLAVSFKLVRADGTLALDALRHTAAQFNSFTPASTETYYVVLERTFKTSTAELPYTLAVNRAPDDVGASPASAGKLSVGSSVTGTLNTGGDHDWFAVTLDANSPAWFLLEGEPEGAGTLRPGTGTAVVTIIDAQGKVLVASIPSGSNNTSSVLPFVPVTHGTYYVGVAQSNGELGSYRLSARPGERDDYGPNAASAGRLTEGVASQGKIEVSSDIDAFKFAATAGHSYTLRYDDPRVKFNSTIAEMTLVDGQGHEVRLDRFNGMLKFDASTSGEFVLTLSGRPNDGETGSYSLLVNSLGNDDYSADKLTTGNLVPGARISGRIGYPTDLDWIKVALEAGKTYAFDLRGSTSAGGTLDTANGNGGLGLADPSGSSLTVKLDTYSQRQTEPHFWFTAPTTANYYVTISGHYQSGSYTLGATTVSDDARSPTLAASSHPGGAAGMGLTANITLTFSEPVTLTDPTIRLVDTTGADVSLRFLSGSPGQPLSNNVVQLDPTSTLTPGMTYTLHIPAASITDWSGKQFDGPMAHSFTAMGTVPVGGPGADFLSGTGLDGSALQGGAGIDTAVYAKARMNYDIRRTGDNVTVSERGKAVEPEVLSGIERLLFTNEARAMDIDGIGGQAYRLYRAAFSREPDQAGVGYWISAMDKGATLREVAHGFVASTEFMERYNDDPSDAGFVKALYQNVLGRTPDSAGAAYWTDMLRVGGQRDDVLAYFSESPENQAALISVIGNGFVYIPYG